MGAGDGPLVATLSLRPLRELLAMHEAASVAVRAMRDLVRRGASVLTEAIAPRASAPAPACVEWRHYPDGDIFDPRGGGLAYFHAHEAAERVPGELGHFHLFASPHRAPVGERRRFVHLVGLSVDAHGQPMRLFTTNRWVTGEAWREAPAVLRLADRFELDLPRPSRPLNRWLGAMPRLFRPQLERLLAERDQRIAARVREIDPSGGSAAIRQVLEDRTLHVVSECAVSLPGQVAALETALSSRQSNAERRRRR